MLFALISVGLAATLSVDPSVSTAYATIQDAIDDAVDGDTITVVAGTFSECLDTGGVSLSIVGDGPTTTVLDAGGLCAYALQIDAGETVELEGMQLRNGGWDGILVDSSTLVAADIRVDDSAASTPTQTAIRVEGGTLELSNASFVGLDGTSDHIEADSSDLTLTECVFDSPATASDTAYVWVESNSTVVSSTNTFSDHSGRAFDLDASTLDSSGDTFDSLGTNSWGMGILAAYKSTITMTGAEANAVGQPWTMPNYPYAPICVRSSTLHLSNANFSSCGGGYGGVLLAGAATVTVDTVTSDNGDAYQGGFAWLSESDVSITDVTVTDSSANHGGAIYATDSTVTGAGLTFDSNQGNHGGDVYTDRYSTVALTDYNATGGTSSLGGSIYSAADRLTLDGCTITGAYASIRGGAILAQGELSINDCSISGNEGDDGGGVYVHDGDADVDISASAFSDNTASSGSGGAVYIRGGSSGSASLSVYDTVFESNTADNNGGALYGYQVGDLRIEASRFIENDANLGGSYGHGGGLHLRDTDAVVVYSNLFCGNTAADGGGAYWTTDATSSTADDWSHNIFLENSASSRGGHLHVDDAAVVSFDQNTLLGGSSVGYGGSVYAADLGGDFTHNIVAYTSAGHGIYGDATTASSTSFQYNDWYSNTSQHTDGWLSFSTTGSGNLEDDPGFGSLTLDGDCTNDDLSLSSTSSLVDGGDPSVTESDGTVVDIGADPSTYTDPTGSDRDGDGWTIADDCNDRDAAIFPGATESCDGEDNDCDGDIDESGATGETTFYLDADGDGYGVATTTTDACDAPSGYTDNTSDCDDSDATVHPGATESCDGEDNDCDGDIDESGATGETTFYADTDGDGFGDAAATLDACVLPSGYSAVDTDCDDTSASTWPGAPETWYDGVDADCAGDSDYDADLDGFDSDAHGGTDCDDTSATTWPGATDDWYDGIDADCAGNSDYDADADGHDLGPDCDDTDPTVHPGADDAWYDGLDDDCAGNSDYDADFDGHDLTDDCDDTDAAIHPGAPDDWYDGVDADCAGNDDHDADADGFVRDDDCDDTDPAVHPGATDDWYDGVDADCAGNSDHDADLDGYDLGDDCDDTDPAIHPGAADDWYDGVDADCAGNSDHDADLDGYDLGDDCDDTDAAVHPGATDDWYDGLDSDCAGNDDYDMDGDGFTSDAHGGTDCADHNSQVYPRGPRDPLDGTTSDCGRDPGEDKSSGCATAPSPVGWLWLTAFVPLVGKRRRL